MKCILPFGLWVSGFLLLPTGRAAAEATPAVTPEAIYDRTAEIVRQNFYDRTLRGLPWNQLVARYRGRLSATAGEEELESTVNDLLANLHASHTEFLSDRDQEYWGISSIFSRQIEGAPFGQIGAWFVQIQGRWYIRDVFDRSPAAAVGLLTGDEMISVDGKAFEPVRSFIDAVGRPVRVAFRRFKGARPQEVQVVPERRGVQSSLLVSALASKRIIAKNGRRIGYFHLWTGTHPKFQEALAEAAREFAPRTDGMILDLRDGFGGSGPEYLNPFFDHDEEGRPIPQVYGHPMVALVNGGTRSGKEGLTYILKHTGRATVMGSRTAGFFLGGAPFTIQPGKFLLFLAIDGNGPPGVDIEGKGVAPNVSVAFELPYSAGKDPQFEAAVAWLENQHPSPTPERG